MTNAAAPSAVGSERIGRPCLVGDRFGAHMTEGRTVHVQHVRFIKPGSPAALFLIACKADPLGYHARYLGVRFRSYFCPATQAPEIPTCSLKVGRNFVVGTICDAAASTKQWTRARPHIYAMWVDFLYF